MTKLFLRIAGRRRPILLAALASVGWLLLPSVTSPSSVVVSRFDIRDYGAKGDGLTIDSAAINHAISTCAGAGGGQVRFPPGNYLAGTLHLKSGVTLWLDAGARLTGCTNLNQYQAFTPPEGTPEARFKRTWHRALILGDGIENVSILGQGVIDGNKVFDPQGEERMRGPHTILLGNSRGIVIRDVTIMDSANYAVLLEDCSKVEVRNVRITGGWDGVHFRGWPGRPCRDVTIVGCQFYTGDDSIAGRYWENVLISDCILNSSCNGIRLIGPAAHLIIHDCLFYGPGVYPHRTGGRTNMLAGVCLQPGAWDATAGNLDDVLVSDVTLHHVTTPFHFALKPGNTAGRITVNRAAATGVYRAAASVESWADTPFTNVVFRDVSIEFEGGGTREQAQMSIKGPGVDARSLPAWGFYARNVAKLVLDNVRLRLAKEDLRPVLIADQVEQLVLDGFNMPPAYGTDALVLNNVTQVEVHNLGLPVIKPHFSELKAIPEGAGSHLIGGQPYTAVVTVDNGSQEGLGQIELVAPGQIMTRWMWFAPEQTRQVVFRGLVAPGAGQHRLTSGRLDIPLTIEPR